MAKKDMKLASQLLMIGAVGAVALSVVGYWGVDIWLASTQWLLVSSVLALFGVYLKMND